MAEVAMNNSRVVSVIEQAYLILSDAIKLKDVELMFDEIRDHKSFFEDWYGRQSYEYKLTNSLLNVVRLIMRSKNEKVGYPKMNVSEWSRTMPIRLQWVKQLRILVDSKQVY